VFGPDLLHRVTRSGSAPRMGIGIWAVLALTRCMCDIASF
jgi:hypothetical protein